MRRNPYESPDDYAERCAELADRSHDHHSQLEIQNPQPATHMAMLGDYLLKLLERCSDEQFGQDAVDYGITLGMVKLTYHLETDLRLIMGEPGKPETGMYDRLCEAWRRECADTRERLAYVEAGLHTSALEAA